METLYQIELLFLKWLLYVACEDRGHLGGAGDELGGGDGLTGT